MRRNRPGFRKFWDDFFAPFRKLPPPDAGSAWNRVLDRLGDDSDVVLAAASAANSIGSVPRKPRWHFRLAVAGIAVAIAVMGAPAILRNYNAMAEAVQGPLYRGSSEDPQAIQTGEKIERGALIRSNGGGRRRLQIAGWLERGNARGV